MYVREFRCIDCDCVFEALVLSANDEAKTVCPECGGRKLEVLFSVFGVSGSDKRVASSSNCTSCMTRNGGTCS